MLTYHQHGPVTFIQRHYCKKKWINKIRFKVAFFKLYTVLPGTNEFSFVPWDISILSDMYYGVHNGVYCVLQEWNTTMLAEQAAKPLTESPAMTLEEIGKKIYDLEREVKYLLTKLKIYKPKPKPKPENETTKLNATKISKWHDICCWFYFGVLIHLPWPPRYFMVLWSSWYWNMVGRIYCVMILPRHSSDSTKL